MGPKKNKKKNKEVKDLGDVNQAIKDNEEAKTEEIVEPELMEAQVKGGKGSAPKDLPNEGAEEGGAKELPKDEVKEEPKEEVKEEPKEEPK